MTEVKMTEVKNVKIDGKYVFTVLQIKNKGNGNLFLHYPKILATESQENGVVITTMEIDHGLICSGTQQHDLELIGNAKSLFITATLIEGKEAYYIREYLKVFGFKYSPDTKTWSKPNQSKLAIIDDNDLELEVS